MPSEPSECNQCHKSFKSLAGLHVHQRKMHKDINSEYGLCKTCNKRFRDHSTLERHISACHQPRTRTSIIKGGNNNTINNTNNITYNNNVHQTINIIQLSKTEQLQRLLPLLQPLSVESLTERINNVIKMILQQNQPLPTSKKEWVKCIYDYGNFINAIVKIDTSRQIVKYWYETMPSTPVEIIDTNCQHLWETIQKVLKANPNITQSYMDFINAGILRDANTQSNFHMIAKKEWFKLYNDRNALEYAKSFAKIAPTLTTSWAANQLKTQSSLTLIDESETQILPWSEEDIFDEILMFGTFYQSLQSQCLLLPDFYVYHLEELTEFVSLVFKQLQFKLKTIENKCVEIQTPDKTYKMNKRKLLAMIHIRLFQSKKIFREFGLNHELDQIEISPEQQQNCAKNLQWICDELDEDTTNHYDQMLFHHLLEKCAN